MHFWFLTLSVPGSWQRPQPASLSNFAWDCAKGGAADAEEQSTTTATAARRLRQVPRAGVNPPVNSCSGCRYNTTTNRMWRVMEMKKMYEKARWILYHWRV